VVAPFLKEKGERGDCKAKWGREGPSATHQKSIHAIKLSKDDGEMAIEGQRGKEGKYIRGEGKHQLGKKKIDRESE